MSVVNSSSSQAFKSLQLELSVAYRYHNPKWSSAENIAAYGERHSESGMGQNLTLQVVLGESADDSLSAKLKTKFDHHFLNERTLETLGQVICAEAMELWGRQCFEIRLFESEGWGTRVRSTGQILSKAFTISGLQLRAARPVLGTFIGTLEIKGTIDSTSGLIASRPVVETWIEKNVIQPLDQKPWDEFISDKGIEALCHVCLEKLNSSYPAEFSKVLSLRVTLSRNAENSSREFYASSRELD